jgi:ribosomal-protein-alanine N-acetyltransferase
VSRAVLAREPLDLAAGAFRLTPLARTDAAEILALFGDPRVVEYMDIDPLTDLAGAREVIDWACDQRMSGKGVRWAVRQSGAPQVIGTCGYNVLEYERGRRGEIAYDLAVAFWGQGVMALVLPAVMAFGYGELGLHRIEAMVTEGNAPSCRLLERHGFRHEGTLRDHAWWKGRFWDQRIYGRLADSAAPPPSRRFQRRATLSV